MLAQVGIRVTFQPSPSATFFPKLTQATASFFEFGWTPGGDPWASMNSIVRTYDGAGSGQFNGGRYSNPKLDQLIDGIRVEPDLATRRTHDRRRAARDARRSAADTAVSAQAHLGDATDHRASRSGRTTCSNCAGCASTEPDRHYHDYHPLFLPDHDPLRTRRAQAGRRAPARTRPAAATGRDRPRTGDAAGAGGVHAAPWHRAWRPRVYSGVHGNPTASQVTEGVTAYKRAPRRLRDRLRRRCGARRRQGGGCDGGARWRRHRVRVGPPAGAAAVEPVAAILRAADHQRHRLGSRPLERRQRGPTHTSSG